MADKVKYLDLGGLTTYDGKIKGVIDSKVAAGVDAIPAMEITSVTQKDFASDGGNTDEFVISYKDNKGASKTTTFKINTPNATPTTEDGYQYGLMSSQDKLNIQNNTDNLSELSSKVDGLVTAGGEPNKIETISLNNKAVSFTVDTAKNADLTLDVDYDTTSKKVRLKSGDTILSSFDASAFIKDGMLNSAEIITVPSDGEEATVDRPAGKYIKLTWNTDAGKDATYIPVKDLLVDYTFKAGNNATYEGWIDEYEDDRGTMQIINYNVGIAPEVSATTASNGTKEITVGLKWDDTSWFTQIKKELDKKPYAGVVRVPEVTTDVINGTGLNYEKTNGTYSLGLSGTLDGQDNDMNKYKISLTDEGSKFAGWTKAIDTQVKTNTDAIATKAAQTDVDTLEEKVDNLVTAGGEPNKIETISLNSKKASFTVDASKNADLTLDVNYDADTKKVQLKSGETVLSDFDASALVKDSDLDSVTLVTIATADATDERPAGKYFKFTWNKDAGKEDVYISAENAYPYIDNVANAGAGYNSETRGSWRIFQTITPTTLPTGDIKRVFGLDFKPGDDVDGKTGNWFKAVEDELDAIPTTYAKAADVDTSLEAKADKTELPTVSANGSISIQDTLNYGDNSFAIDLGVTKTGVNNEVKLSESGFTTWVSAVDTQVKTNTDAIAGIPSSFKAGDLFSYGYYVPQSEISTQATGPQNQFYYNLLISPQVEIVDNGTGNKQLKISLQDKSLHEANGSNLHRKLLDHWKDIIEGIPTTYVAQADKITTEDIDKLFA